MKNKIAILALISVTSSVIGVALAAPGPSGAPPTPNYPDAQFNKVKAEGGNSSFQSLSVPNDLAGASIKIDSDGIYNPGLNYNGAVQVNDDDGLRLLNNSPLTSQGGGVYIGDSGAGGQSILRMGKLLLGVFTSMLEVDPNGVLIRTKANQAITALYTGTMCYADGGNILAGQCIYPVSTTDSDGFLSRTTNKTAITGVASSATGISGYSSSNNGVFAGTATKTGLLGWADNSNKSSWTGPSPATTAIHGISIGGIGVLGVSGSTTDGTTTNTYAGRFYGVNSSGSTVNEVRLGTQSNSIEADKALSMYNASEGSLVLANSAGSPSILASRTPNVNQPVAILTEDPLACDGCNQVQLVGTNFGLNLSKAIMNTFTKNVDVAYSAANCTADSGFNNSIWGITWCSYPVIINDTEGFRVNSSKGINMNAADSPMITRGWDAFTSGAYKDLGRWGLFMEPQYLTAGFPTINSRGFKVSSYNANSTKTDLLTLERTAGGTTRAYLDVNDFTMNVNQVTAAALLTVNGSLTVWSNASKPGGGSWATTSDQRLKDIKGEFQTSLEAIKTLNPVFYNYKKNNQEKLPSEKTYVGLIAQEVQKVIPEAVSTDGKGYLQLNNDPIIWAMLNSIKELAMNFEQYNTKLEKLEKENQDLKNSIKLLDERLEKLESNSK